MNGPSEAPIPLVLNAFMKKELFETQQNHWIDRLSSNMIDSTVNFQFKEYCLAELCSFLDIRTNCFQIYSRHIFGKQTRLQATIKTFQH